MNPCEWHKDDQPSSPSDGCQYCGTLYSTKDCEGCRQVFLDWADKSFDDIIAGPYVSESGDLMCMRCGPRRDQEREQYIEDEYEYEYEDDLP